MRGGRTLAAGASALAFVGGGAAGGEGFGHPDSAAAPNVVLLPPRGHRVYHAAFSDFGGPEDRVSKARIHSFERPAGRRIVWAYFSNNWLRGRIRFPAARVRTISQAGRGPVHPNDGPVRMGAAAPIPTFHFAASTRAPGTRS